MTTTEAKVSDSVTPVRIGAPRGGPAVVTLRRGLAWRITPWLTYAGFSAFVVYGTWAAFRNGSYYAGSAQGRDYLSPFYSPCLTKVCPTGAAWQNWSWWRFSPALVVLIFPMGFRLTCYYYRKAYYRSFWFSPHACAVADAHGSYSGERRFPLVLNNAHRYFWYFAMVFAVILSWDAVVAFRFPGGRIGMGLGTVIFVVNAILIWLYTVSCHSCRHLCGGRLNRMSEHPVRRRLWRMVTPLNAHHMLYAWVSLAWIAGTDFYVWLVAAGHVTDPRFF